MKKPHAGLWAVGAAIIAQLTTGCWMFTKDGITCNACGCFDSDPAWPSTKMGKLPIYNTCTSHADCGETCYCRDNLCAKACQQESDCRSGEVCVDGACGPVPLPALACNNIPACDNPGGPTCEGGWCADAQCGRPQDCLISYFCAYHGRCIPQGSQPPPRACSISADCAHNGYTCDQDICLPISCWQIDTPCPTGWRCDIDQCINNKPPPCARDTQCAKGQRCFGGTCAELARDPSSERCVLDRACGPVGQCVNGMCAFACTTDTDCTRTQACVSGLCQDHPTGGGACVLHSDCGGNIYCINGSCVPFCDTDDACDVGEFCDNNLCHPDWRPRPECADADDCTAGLFCVNGACRAPCDDDTPCANDLICDAGACFEPQALAPECRARTDCATDQACVNAQCVDWR